MSRLHSRRAVLAAICSLFLATSTFAADAKPVKKRTPKKRAPNPAFAPVTDDPALPRVLLIGDSISIGYTVPVQKLLAGKANVHRIPTNGGPTTRGLANIDAWIGDKPWDVIHFNFGLHDLKYVDENLKNSPPDKGRQQVGPEDYRKNLTTIVERLEKTGAKLIWRPTTPVPPGAHSRIAAAEGEYNRIAAEVIADRNIAVNDLNPLIHSQPELQKKADVHFTPEGSQALAESVVASIEDALK